MTNIDRIRAALHELRDMDREGEWSEADHSDLCDAICALAGISVRADRAERRIRWNAQLPADYHLPDTDDDGFALASRVVIRDLMGAQS